MITFTLFSLLVINYTYLSKKGVDTSPAKDKVYA